MPGSSSSDSRADGSGTVKPRSSRVFLASSNCVLVTSGTSTLPEARRTSTSEPFSTVAPLSGSVLETVPCSWGTFSGSPSTITRPASSSADRAASRVIPSSPSGTCTDSGPAETRTSTVEPTSASSPSPGVVSMTTPASTSWDSCGVKDGSNPASRRIVPASSSVSPTTPGTTSISGPRWPKGSNTAIAAPISASTATATRMISHQGFLRSSTSSTSSPVCRASGPVVGVVAEAPFQLWARRPAAPAAPAPAIAGSASVASSTGPSTVVASGSSPAAAAEGTRLGARPPTTAAMSREKATALG